MWPFTSSPASSSPPEKSQSQHPSAEAGADKCPVDHTARSAWLAANPGGDHPFASSSSSSSSGLPSLRGNDGASGNPGLSQNRVISSIPRGPAGSWVPPPSAQGPSSDSDPNPSPAASGHGAPEKDANGNWVYPSEQQFFNAMLRKNHSPNPRDMRTIVPIHNAVNERAWEEILKWEAMAGGARFCGGPKLVSFVGRPKERTPKAWVKTALGYTPPFDRHDWVIDRCGTHIRYVIDFYTGRQALDGKPSFYLDVRPALDDLEGAKMRVKGLWN